MQPDVEMLHSTCVQLVVECTVKLLNFNQLKAQDDNRTMMPNKEFGQIAMTVHRTY